MFFLSFALFISSRWFLRPLPTRARRYWFTCNSLSWMNVFLHLYILSLICFYPPPPSQRLCFHFSHPQPKSPKILKRGSALSFLLKATEIGIWISFHDVVLVCLVHVTITVVTVVTVSFVMVAVTVVTVAMLRLLSLLSLWPFYGCRHCCHCGYVIVAVTVVTVAASWLLSLL